MFLLVAPVFEDECFHFTFLAPIKMEAVLFVYTWLGESSCQQSNDDGHWWWQLVMCPDFLALNGYCRCSIGSSQTRNPKYQACLIPGIRGDGPTWLRAIKYWGLVGQLLVCNKPRIRPHPHDRFEGMVNQAQNRLVYSQPKSDRI